MHSAIGAVARLAFLLATCVSLEACRPADATSSERVGPRNDGFWWRMAGDHGAAIACFGAAIETSEGSFRPWSLVVHLPGSDERLSCTQGLLPLAESSPILSEGGTFRVELRPCDGCAWSEVASEEQIVASVLGLH